MVVNKINFFVEWVTVRNTFFYENICVLEVFGATFRSIYPKMSDYEKVEYFG